MSLLDVGTEDVLIYREIAYTDDYGTTMYKTSTVGVPAKAVIQIIGQSGTSSRRAEQLDEGYETEETYRMRLPRSYEEIVGANAAVQWRGGRYSVIGHPRYYLGSRRTAHVEYQLRRV